MMFYQGGIKTNRGGWGREQMREADEDDRDQFGI